MSDRELSFREWRETPYASSKAKDGDADIQKLLAKYGVEASNWTQCRSPHGRKAVILRFNLNHHTYRIAIESLNCPEAPEVARVKQATRAVYWMLKSTLEAATVFWSAEEALYAFLELPDGKTMYEASKDRLAKLTAANFAELVWDEHKLLPDKRES